MPSLLGNVRAQNRNLVCRNALRSVLHEDKEGLTAVDKRAAPSVMSYEALLKNLKAHDKI
ncbi:MAG: hypothetical protein WCI66_01600 [Gammaproteobacteria bacterium]